MVSHRPARPGHCHHAQLDKGVGGRRTTSQPSEWISNWAYAGFRNHSVRQVVRVGAGGSSLRLRLSNVYGTAPSG